MWASRRGLSSLSTDGKRTTYYALAIIQGDREEAFGAASCRLCGRQNSNRAGAG